MRGERSSRSPRSPDLLREVCTERFGSVEHAVADGLPLRYDGGSCLGSHHYQAEIDFLGSRQPGLPRRARDQRRGLDKFIQTLKEQVLWLERFDRLESRARIRRFARDSDEHWLIERYGFRTPAHARQMFRRPPSLDHHAHPPGVR